jgi:hypothetical protein
MGFYINPADMTKEEWFDKNVQRYSNTPVEHNYLKDDDLVCCVWFMNPGFTALGIAFSKNELVAFSDPSDPRLKRWGYFPRKIVEPYLFGQKIEGVDYGND